MRKIIVLVVAMLFVTGKAVAKNESTDIVVGKKLSMQSTLLGEERKYWVHLPKKYDESKSYPVVYLLDGNSHFESTIGVLRHMSRRGQIPEMILVAILNTDRTRDLTPSHATLGPDGKEAEWIKTSGGSKNFLKFIKQELMPQINKEYATAPHNLLVGHSFGGLFALYALLEDPSVFQSYISIDPSIWWDQEMLNTKLAKQLDKSPSGYRSVYIAAANNPDRPGFPEQMMIKPQKKFFSQISTWNGTDFQASIDYFPTEDHGSVPLIALYKGLNTIFSGFKLNYESVASDTSGLNRHYDLWSHKMGYELDPPENVINNLGYSLMTRGDLTSAIKYLTENTVNFPNSSNTYDSLAEAYVKSGNIEMAVKNYEKFMEIEGKDERVEKIIADLKSK